MSNLPSHSTGAPQNSPPGTPPNGTPPNGTPIPGDLSTPGLDLVLSEDEELDAPNIPGRGIGTGNPDLLDAQELTAHHNGLKDTLTTIEEIRNASLDAQFEEELDIDDRYLRLSLDMYLILADVSQEMYRELVAVCLRCHPEAKGRLLSFDQIKRRVKNLTGIVPIHDDVPQPQELEEKAKAEKAEVEKTEVEVISTPILV